MQKCAYCGTYIVFGGKKAGQLRFCSDKCYQRGVVTAVSAQVPQHVVQENAWKIYKGLCPICGGDGPVDVHESYRVYSVLVITRWKSIPQISCRSCGVKSQMRNAAYSFLLGWWGIPFGLILTPIQVGRNIAAVLNDQDPAEPSIKLKSAVQKLIAQNAIAIQGKQAGP